MSEEVAGTQEEQPQTVNYKDFINEDGTFTDAFYTSHPSELGKHSIISRYKSLDDLGNGQINASQTITTKIDDWIGSDKEEHIKQRLKLSGVPSDVSEYEIRYPESFSDLPDESQSAINAYMKESAQWALENGVSKEVFEKFVERDLARAVEIQQAQQQEYREAFDKADGDLRKKWGGRYDNNVARAENMAKALNMEDIIPVLKQDPVMLEAFHDGASKLMSDDTLIEVTQRDTMQTSKDRLAELDSRMLNYKGSTSDPEYQTLIQRKMQILKTMPKSNDDFPVLS